MHTRVKVNEVIQYNNVIQLIFRLVEAKKTESHSKTEKEVASANYSVRG